jgi:hypothetical protein
MRDKKDKGRAYFMLSGMERVLRRIPPFRVSRMLSCMLSDSVLLGGHLVIARVRQIRREQRPQCARNALKDDVF